MEVILRAVLAKLDKEIRGHDAAVSYDKLPRVPGDPDRLSQVFENLLRNALRHRGQAPPRIHITAEKQADMWLFVVRDAQEWKRLAWKTSSSRLSACPARNAPVPDWVLRFAGQSWNGTADGFGPNRMREPAARFSLLFPPTQCRAGCQPAAGFSPPLTANQSCLGALGGCARLLPFVRTEFVVKGPEAQA